MFNNVRNTDNVNIQSAIFVETFSPALYTGVPKVTKRYRAIQSAELLLTSIKKSTTKKILQKVLRDLVNHINNDTNTKDLTNKSCVIRVLRKVIKYLMKRVRKSIGRGKRDAPLADLERPKNSPKQTLNMVGNIVHQ